MKRSTIRLMVRAAVALTALLLAAFLGVASGVVPIAASSGHFAVTHWLLHFAMRRSVSTHSVFVQARERDEPWRVLKGAGHFETGCRPCHGAPDLQPPVVGRAMLPPPPWLSPRVSAWDRHELFYIVKNGVKFTGMPAWPSQQRDDEVWALVDFLVELPKLDARSYRELVDGRTADASADVSLAKLVPDEAVNQSVLESCARCHGARGEGRGSAAFPKLAGQHADYQVAALKAYATGQRHSGIMQPIAAGLSAAEMRSLARYYADSAPTGEQSGGRRSGQAERGRAIVNHGLPEQGVPPCMECHGPGPDRRNAHYPALAGQYADYLILQLELLKARTRGGSPYVHLMHQVADRLSMEQMQDVAQYYASLPTP